MSKRVRDINELKKRQTLKYLLRKVVRAVIINRQWLEKGEAEEDRTISSNVNKNILMVVRARRKMGVLTNIEKTLLRIPQMLRTIDERKKLCALMAELECFCRLPPILRARLVPVLKIMVLDKGRLVVKQGDMPITMFFIVSGEVILFKYAESKKERTELTLKPGDCIGDVALIEECLRTSSCITKSQCELLVLFEHDFINILKPFMTKLWNDKKRAIKALDYFDFLNEEQLLTACKLSTIKQYQPLDTIYSREKGSLTNVHFVLSGECVILQCLNMKVIVKNGKKQYELADTSDVHSSVNGEANTDLFEAISTLNNYRGDNIRKKENVHYKLGRKEIEAFCQNLNDKKITNILAFQSFSSLSSYLSQLNDPRFLQEEIEDVAESSTNSWGSYGSKSRDNSHIEEIQSKKSVTETGVFEASLSSSSSSYSSSSSSSLKFQLTLPKYESHFIDVGSITFGGIFGLGEQTVERVIMARNTVQCLLLPRFFLMKEDQNPGGIWQRRIFYLDCMIPSRENLFEDFVQNIKWKKFKNDFIQQSIKFNTTETARGDDIPILCRIEAEEND